MDPFDRLSSLGQFRMTLGLGRIGRLMDMLSSPQLMVPSVHVAGTNGKGSTCHMLDSILSGFQMRRSLYTSPHLMRINERFLFDGAEVEDRELHVTLENIFELIDGRFDPADTPTYFEILTAAYFKLALEKGSDLNIVEVGMGGRYDATNILEPQAVAITSIALDHQEHLGDEEVGIAKEKAGIIRPSTPVVIGPIHRSGEEGKRVLRTIVEICSYNGCPMVLISPPGDVGMLRLMLLKASVPDGRIITIENIDIGEGTKAMLNSVPLTDEGTFHDRLALLDLIVQGEFCTPLIGRHQAYNMACAICLALLSLPAAHSNSRLKEGESGALEGLINGSSDSFLDAYDPEDIRYRIVKGLMRTVIYGRTERSEIDGTPVLFDGGHNREAARSFSETASLLFPGIKGPLLISMMEDKDATGYMEEIRDSVSSVIVTRIDNQRAMPQNLLVEKLSKGSDGGIGIEAIEDPDHAFEAWLTMAVEQGLGLVGGSFYLYSQYVDSVRKPR